MSRRRREPEVEENKEANQADQESDEEKENEPGYKKCAKGGRRSSCASKLNPENQCKYGILSKLYRPCDAEWDKVYASDSWFGHPERIQTALDEGWVIEQARMARQEAEQAATAARLASNASRNQHRREEVREINHYLRQKDLSIVHEAAEAKPPDKVAAANPCSEEYSGRAKRQRRKPSAPSPELDEELEEDASQHGVKILATHKANRQNTRVIDPNVLRQAKDALSKLPTDVAQSLVSSVTAKKATVVLHPKQPRSPAKKKARTSADEAVEGLDKVAVAAEVDKLYTKKLKEINNRRQDGGLNSASRKLLLDKCRSRINNPNSEQGFAGTALQPAWDDQFTDKTRHPASTSDPENTDEEEDED